MNSNIPKVSVVMPTYRPDEAMFREAIQSILNQTFTDFELIVCDDASPESPEAIVQSFQDPRICFYRNEKNLGIAGNTNRLWELARGEYVANMDHDDIALPCRLEKTVAYLDAHPEVSAVGGWMEFFPKKKDVFRPVAHPRIIDLVKGDPCAHSTMLFRKADFLSRNLRYRELYRFAMDYDLWARAMRELRVENLQEVFLQYRWYPENTSSQNFLLQMEERLKIRRSIIDFLTDDPYEKKILTEMAWKHSSFAERLFSIRNEDLYKVIFLLGMKFRFRRKKYRGLKDA